MILRFLMTAWGKTAEEPERGSPYAWFVILLWMTCGLFGFVAVFNVGILLPAITEDFSLSPSQQGILGSIALWGNLILGIPIGWWTARFGPKIVVGVALLISGGLLFLGGWSPIFSVLLVARLLFGVTLFALEPPGGLLVQQWFPQNRIVTVNSINSLFFGVMMGGGLFLTPFVLELANGQWRVTFYLFGALVLFLTVVWMIFARERRDSGRGEIQQQELPQSTGIVASALKHPDMWVAGFGMVGAGLVWSAFMSFFPTFALETHDISLRWSGAILALSLTTGGLAGLAAAYLLRSNNFRREILIVLGICVAGGYAAMTLIGSPSLLMIVAFVAGVGGGYFPVLYSVPFQIPVRHPKQVSVGIAFILTSLSLGTVLGPLITGYLQEMFGRLDISLLIVSLAGLSICISGILLSPLRQSNISGKTPT